MRAVQRTGSLRVGGAGDVERRESHEGVEMVAMAPKQEQPSLDGSLDWEAIGRLVHESTILAIAAHIESLVKLCDGDGSGETAIDFRSEAS